MFFHASAVKPEELTNIVRGARVEFEVILKKGKEQACSVTVVAPPTPISTTAPSFPKKRVVSEDLSELEEFEREWGLRAVN